MTSICLTAENSAILRAANLLKTNCVFQLNFLQQPEMDVLPTESKPLPRRLLVRLMPITRAEDAYRIRKHNETIGKVILSV